MLFSWLSHSAGRPRRPSPEAQARAEANEIVKHLATLDGYPFDARYSEGARDQAVRLADLTRDAYDYFAAVFPGVRPQLIATYLKPVDWKRNYGVPSYYPPDKRLRVATDDNPMWQSLGRVVHVASPFGAYPRLKQAYGDEHGHLQLRRFFDLFTVQSSRTRSSCKAGPSCRRSGSRSSSPTWRYTRSSRRSGRLVSDAPPPSGACAL